MSIVKVNVVFKTSKSQTGFLYDMDKYFMKCLDIDVQQTFSFAVCPFPGTDATSKVLSRPVFTIFVFIVSLTLFSFTFLAKRIFSQNRKISRHFTKNNLRKFELKLIEGFIETVKYSYSGFTRATFLLLSCVDTGNQNVWQLNAEVSCFSTLQVCAMVFAACYTVPLVFISSLAGKMLKMRVIP